MESHYALIAIETNIKKVGEVMSYPLIPGGYILLSRKIIDSEIWNKPPLYLKVWVYLLSLAQYKDYKQMKRGQLRTSIPEIIEACSWRVGARIERPTKDQVYQILNWLRKPNEGGSESNTKATMITTTKATHGLLINIDNYCFYQDSKNYESNDESNDENSTKETRKQRQPDNINKKEEELKENKEEQISYFRSFYSDEQLKVIDQYFDVIASTRKSKKLSPSVVKNEMEYWSKFQRELVIHSLEIHIKDHKGKKEEYTRGIIRNAKPEDLVKVTKLTEYQRKKQEHERRWLLVE